MHVGGWSGYSLSLRGMRNIYKELALEAAVAADVCPVPRCGHCAVPYRPKNASAAASAAFCSAAHREAARLRRERVTGPRLVIHP
jgi:hypothetical protein